MGVGGSGGKYEPNSNISRIVGWGRSIPLVEAKIPELKYVFQDIGWIPLIELKHYYDIPLHVLFQILFPYSRFSRSIDETKLDL